jgi:hypothetical protein
MQNNAGSMKNMQQFLLFKIADTTSVLIGLN